MLYEAAGFYEYCYATDISSKGSLDMVYFTFNAG